ncbi:MAG: hypothetical protein QG675_111 [Patescibacteria group bacterium]|jgi:1,2-diacylglycerol 3-beta-galactosyltransferase|nr:hypothetical protein [Patescibacteria group bacterium]
MNKPKTILVLSAKTGGGHRAAALATISSLNMLPEKYNIIHHDIFENAPRPINSMPKFYSKITNVKSAWGAIYKLTEGNRQSQLTIKTGARLYKKNIYKILNDYQPDVILSFHFAANVFLQEAQSMDRHIPFITVVTDLATCHPMWFDKRNDLIVVPSTDSYTSARKYGIASSKIKIIGLPVSEDFSKPTNKQKLKKSLSWPTDIPTILVMAGGDGMGKIASLCRKIDKIKTDAHLAIVAGRNENLYQALAQRKFKNPITLYRFSTEIPKLMHASDVLLTKAGPGTITESIVSRLPIVLYDFLPGQEEGNILYVVESGAGVWASTNTLALKATEDILDGTISFGGPKFETVRKQHVEAAAKISKLVVSYL